MTDQSKIPLPEEKSDAATLIERAVKTFDLKSYAPPPIPADLLPPVGKGKRRVRQTIVAAQVEVEEHEDGTTTTTPMEAVVMTSPVVTVPAESIPAGTVIDDPVPSAPMQGAPAPAAPLMVEVEPVKFTGPAHPVDRQLLRDQGMIVPEGAVSGVNEEFRIVKRQLMLQAAELRRDGGGSAAQRVLICSPHPNEGKTFCAVNLALSIAAEKEGDVVLVDADFAKPSILSTLGLPGGPGLMDALRDPKIDVADCVIGTDVPGLWVLPAGNATNSDSEYLNSSRTVELLDRLTQGSPKRVVIFDSPPALAASPAAELAKYVGQVLVIARADRTGQSALEDAISLLSACPNIQLLLNAVTFSPSGRRFGDYYGYKG